VAPDIPSCGGFSNNRVVLGISPSNLIMVLRLTTKGNKTILEVEKKWGDSILKKKIIKVEPREDHIIGNSFLCQIIKSYLLR